MAYGRTRHNWYATADPVGTRGNVIVLIRSELEHIAGKRAQAHPVFQGQAFVTLKKLHPKQKPYTYGGDDDKRSA